MMKIRDLVVLAQVEYIEYDLQMETAHLVLEIQ